MVKFGIVVRLARFLLSIRQWYNNNLYRFGFETANLRHVKTKSG